jgi:uncharacterized protein YdeI (YjbR/CyaY-like superfamily)
MMMGVLKESVIIWFFRAAQLSAPERILEKPSENSRFARCIRFTDGKTIASLRQVILSYIHEAIEIENSRKKWTLAKIHR